MILSVFILIGIVKLTNAIYDLHSGERFVEIKEGELICNETLFVADEKYRGVVRLAMQAHEKSKFNNGIVYLNCNDGHEHSDALHDGRIYYTAYSHHQSEAFKQHCGPDFSAHAWPSANIFSFDETVAEIMEASNQKPKTSKVGWFGTVEIAANRQKLMHLSIEHPDYFDFRQLTNHGLHPHLLRNKSEVVSLSELVDSNSYLLDIQGQGYSARLKYLLYSNRPLFYVERDYVEYFNHELKPFVHYIPIKNDLSNLLNQYTWALENADKAKEIASNALEYAKANLTHDKFVDKLSETFRLILSGRRRMKR